MLKPELVFTQAAGEALRKYCFLNGIDNAIILVDQNTRRHCLPLLGEFSFPIIEILSGEENKNILTVQNILDGLIKLEAKRDSTLINLGGGVLCDIGGFAASIYMRGIPFINIPTTLLAMADAAIGGKTGIDYKNLKNIAGSFYMPETILISDEFINTLEEDDVKSAWAEIVKTACILNAGLMNKISEKQDIIDIIIDCATSKQEVVAQDFKDRGRRQLLNFGHTIGHAYESYRLATNNAIKHGYAVAKGMLMEIDIAIKLGILDAKIAHEMKSMILDKTAVEPINNVEFHSLLEFVYNDKKNTNNDIVFSLPIAKGEGVIGIKLSAEELKNWKNQGFI